MACLEPAGLRESRVRSIALILLCATVGAALLDARVGVSEERLAQEAALLATKADVREEIDRLADSLARILGAESAAEPGAAVGGTAGRKA